MAKKSTKKKAAKAVKRIASKNVAKKSVSKKAVKKVMKKNVLKIAAKKATPKKSVKKIVKNAASRKSTKNGIPKKIVKKLVPKKVSKKPTVKKVVTKKLAPKKVVVKKKVLAKPIKAIHAVAPSTPRFVKHNTHLKVGDAMPFFGGQDQHGNTVTSASFSGKKLVVYFYPKDDTPGCTIEACNLRDNYGMFKAHGYEIIGVSKDPISSHKKFADKYGLPFSLIADEDATIQKLFGAWGTKMFMGKVYDGTNRFTFVSDEKHIITKVIQEVDTKEHTSQIL